jgi:hypothetical protein
MNAIGGAFTDIMACLCKTFLGLRLNQLLDLVETTLY